jgi:exodeoxyribonuclease VII small subunit
VTEPPATFEDAMTRLEQIVSELETGKHSLEESLRMFEEGIALGKRCREFLDRADVRVRTLVEAADGSLVEGASLDEGDDEDTDDRP